MLNFTIMNLEFKHFFLQILIYLKLYLNKIKNSLYIFIRITNNKSNKFINLQMIISFIIIILIKLLL